MSKRTYQNRNGLITRSLLFFVAILAGVLWLLPAGDKGNRDGSKAGVVESEQTDANGETKVKRRPWMYFNPDAKKDKAEGDTQ